MQSAIPSNTGFTTQWDNIGSTSNKGVELGLNASLVEKKDFVLGMNFNVAKNVAKIDELDGTDSRFFQSNWASTDLKDRDDDYYIEVGGKLGDIYGYVTDGYYLPSDFASYNEASDNYTLNDGFPIQVIQLATTRFVPDF